MFARGDEECLAVAQRRRPARFDAVCRGAYAGGGAEGARRERDSARFELTTISVSSPPQTAWSTRATEGVAWPTAREMVKAQGALQEGERTERVLLW